MSHLSKDTWNLAESRAAVRADAFRLSVIWEGTEFLGTTKFRAYAIFLRRLFHDNSFPETSFWINSLSAAMSVGFLWLNAQHKKTITKILSISSVLSNRALSVKELLSSFRYFKACLLFTVIFAGFYGACPVPEKEYINDFSYKERHCLLQ